MINLYYANAYCSEDISNIENYDKAIADKDNTWICHHRLEIHEDYRNSVEELQMMNLYWHRPASELIFVTKAEHRKIHQRGVKRIFTEEHKLNISKAHKGLKVSDETKQKISNSSKGKVIPNEIRLKLSKSLKGKKLTDEHKRALSDGWKHREHGPNLGRKFTDEHKNKISMAFKGKHWKVINGKRVWIKEDI